MLTAPDGTIYKEFYGSGWQRGLAVQSQVWSGGSLQKSTTTSWTQDNINANYQTNPRVNETNVFDSAGNHSHTTIGYDTFMVPYDNATPPHGTSCSLPNEVYEYEADGTTIARHTHTDYVKDTNYLKARIIGLPQAKLLYDGASALVAKSTYVYDWDGEYLQNQPAAATQHDGGYSTDFVIGRGNLVDVLRWDVTDPTNSTKAFESKMGYDTNGSPIFARDPLPNHQTTISYNDAFSADGTNLDAARSFATFAYPTTVTDADGYSSSVRYYYDFGAVTWKQTPQPNVVTNTPGPVQKFEYDSIGRLKRVTNSVNDAFTRYQYGPNYVFSYSTINNAADEAFSYRGFDGAGRLIRTSQNNPGTVGHYNAQVTQYDRMGRVMEQSNPTEVLGNWTPAGDDVAGWIFTQQTYDWKGRPLLTTHVTDGTTKQASYSACGCAGSEIVTFTDEMGRQQRVYSDVLGRTAKTEVLTDAGVYATTVNRYNVRDQVTLVRQYQGSEQSGVYKDTTMSYDGYGRLRTKHLSAEQIDSNNSESTDHSTWAYNADDTVQSVTDARGASATYSYNNNRRLVSAITYGTPATVTATANVSFAYDAVGNRTSMSDGSGSTSYSYDQLSQITSETRQFAGLSGSYTLGYEYALSGAVTKVTDQTAGTSFTSSLDNSGRVSGVSTVGSDGGVTQFAPQIQYRASGALKSMAYHNNTNLSLGYNERGFVSMYTLNGVNSGSIAVPVAGAYQYYADGQVKFAQDQGSGNSMRDRAYDYDQTSRLKEAYSGSEARDFINGTNSGTATGPYRQSFTYDAWNNTLSGGGRFWSRMDVMTASYDQSNRNPNWSYDAEGNATVRNETNALPSHYGYDAAGREASIAQISSCLVEPRGLHQLRIYTNRKTYDGDGQLTRYQQTRTSNGQVSSGWPVTSYYLRSTVLGGRVISQYQGESGQASWSSTYVYAGGQRIGTLSMIGGGAARNFWRATDPLTGDETTTTDNGELSTQTTFDPQGVDVGSSDPFPPPGEGDGQCIEYDPNYTGPRIFAANLIPEGSAATCVIDGIQQNCQSVGSEAAAQCPDNDCGPRWNRNRDGQGRAGWEYLLLTSEGFSYQSLGPSTRPPGLKPPTLSQRGASSNSGGTMGGSFNDNEGYDNINDAIIPVRYDLPQRIKPIPATPEALLDDCRVRAMLDALATAEGTDADADGGYGRVVRGTVLKAPNNPALVGQSDVTITDFTQHPNILVQVNANLTSTAAGRYQFLYDTWTGFNLSDFGSHNQDIGAVMLLKQNGSIKPLLKDNVTQAVSNSSRTWASLPGSPWGQPTMTMTDFQNAYNRALQNCQNTPRRMR